jgi:hypothetical protein
MSLTISDDVRAMLSALAVAPGPERLVLGCSDGAHLVRALRRSGRLQQGQVLPTPSSAILAEGVAECSSSSTERPCGR